jgi:glycosyltransferase involved in cell wall biosynthesis
MPKIAIFLTALDGGGAEKVMLNLAKGFIELGIEVDLLLVKAEGAYLAQIPSQVRLVDLKQNRLLTSIFGLINYLKTEQPQALLTALDTNVIAAWVRRWTRISTTTIVTVHNNLSLESKYANSLKRKLTAKFAAWFYAWADNIVAVSEGVALDLIKIGLPKEKIKVIYNPIVTSELIEKIQETPDHPWLEAGQPPVILGVGRLTKQKDFSTLLRAFAIVCRQIPAKLMILGEGEERSALEFLLRELNLESDVALIGFVDNPYKYMSKASLLVLSSVWEGFGNVLVEAMAASIPVVSTNCDSGPAEILAQGKYGKLVPIKDSDGLAQAIVQTLQEKLDTSVLPARASEFCLEKAVNQYADLCNNLLDKK